MGASYHSFLFSAVFLAVLLTGCLAAGFDRAPEPISRPGEQNIKMGAVYEQRGEWQNALVEYTEATRHTDRGYVALGNLYARRGDLTEAEKYFRLAMRSIRDNAVLYNDLAGILLEQKKHLDEAEELAVLSVKIADQKQFATSWDTLNAVRQARSLIQTPSEASKETVQVEQAAVQKSPPMQDIDPAAKNVITPSAPPSKSEAPAPKATTQQEKTDAKATQKTPDKATISQKAPASQKAAPPLKKGSPPVAPRKSSTTNQKHSPSAPVGTKQEPASQKAGQTKKTR